MEQSGCSIIKIHSGIARLLSFKNMQNSFAFPFNIDSFIHGISFHPLVLLFVRRHFILHFSKRKKNEILIWFWKLKLRWKKWLEMMKMKWFTWVFIVEQEETWVFVVKEKSFQRKIIYRNCNQVMRFFRKKNAFKAF